jgi:hypothetical protein
MTLAAFTRIDPHQNGRRVLGLERTGSSGSNARLTVVGSFIGANEGIEILAVRLGIGEVMSWQYARLAETTTIRRFK